MKHLEVFETWTSTATDNIAVNYGDKPKVSEIVQYVEDYIQENFDKIKQVELVRKYISFSNTDEKISHIMLSENNLSSHDIYSLSFSYVPPKNYKGTEIDITKEEYDYLVDLFFEIDFKIRRINQKPKYDDVISDLDPLKRAAKKYNL